MRINPEMHIPEEASAVHGIYDADVAAVSYTHLDWTICALSAVSRKYLSIRMPTQPLICGHGCLIALWIRNIRVCQMCIRDRNYTGERIK